MEVNMEDHQPLPSTQTPLHIVPESILVKGEEGRVTKVCDQWLVFLRHRRLVLFSDDGSPLLRTVDDDGS